MGNRFFISVGDDMIPDNWRVIQQHPSTFSDVHKRTFTVPLLIVATKRFINTRVMGYCSA